jgi:hypothetical protein
MAANGGNHRRAVRTVQTVGESVLGYERKPWLVRRWLDCANGLPRLPQSISSAPSGAKPRKSCSEALKLSWNKKRGVSITSQTTD